MKELAEIEDPNELIERLRNELSGIKPSIKYKQQTPQFPVEVFPEWLQSIMSDLHDARNLSPQHLALSALISYGRCFSKLKAETPNNYIALPTFWGVIVDTAGGAKTESVTCFTSILREFDTRGDDLLGSEPKLYIVQDTTTEAVIKICSKQKDGLICHFDEISSFIGDMDKYRNSKGSDKAFWLTIWNGKGFTKIRAKEEDPLPVDPVPLSVIGTTQILSLSRLFENKDHTGFIDRFLFSIEKNDMQLWSKVKKAKLDDTIKTTFKNCIALNDERTIKFDSDASDTLFEWQAQRVQMVSDNSLNDYEQQTFKKDEIYISRIALVLHCLRYAHVKTIPDTIEQKTALNAVYVIEFFAAMRENVNSHLIDQNSKQTNHKKVGEILAESNLTKAQQKKLAIDMRDEGYPVDEIIKNIGVSRATYFRYIK